MTTTVLPVPAHRPMRADAQRNYERILAVAREVFAERGADASLDEIARRAGVGPGTLYRHFPTREDLHQAVIRDWVEVLRAKARDLLVSPSPGDALATWLRTFIGNVTTYRGLAAALMTGIRDEGSSLHASCEAMSAGAVALFSRAQEAGAVRPDADVSDVIMLVHAIALATEQAHVDVDQADRLLSLVMDGLRPQDTTSS